MTADRDAYDELPYPGDPVQAMHPDRLAALGFLHGLETASPSACRVLELGCCDGGNLIPLALAYPQSHFVGIDLSRTQIAAGQREVAALGLTNLELRAVNLTEVTADWGQFDYLLCHGVYSWVPAAVQQKIARIFAENLAPAGVAYCSYNTYPGWHRTETLRRLLLPIVQAETDRQRQAARSREYLARLGDALEAHPTHALAELLPTIRELLRRPDAYLVHEYLEENNQPLWFREFLARFEAAGLQFLCESNLALSEPGLLLNDLQALLDPLAGDRRATEQSLDIVHRRSFRQSLLGAATVPVLPEPDPSRLLALHVSTEATETMSNEPGRRLFALPAGNKLTTADPELGETLELLGEMAPESVAVRDLGLSPYSLLSLWGSLRAGFLSVHREPVPVAGKAGPFPRVSPWALRQIQHGLFVTDLKHRLIELDPVERWMLPLLDGHTPRERLIDCLEAEVQAGRIVLHQPPRSPEQTLRARLGEIVEILLRNLARQALLMASSS